MTSSGDNAARYMRQIMVREFGGQGQRALADAHIAIIGMGGIGTPVALYLAAAGVGKLSLYDDDTIDASNLHRQVLYETGDIGSRKVDVAAKRLHAMNPDLAIARFGQFNMDSHTDATLWIDGTDRLATRLMINARAAELRARLISASLAQWEGQIAYFDAGQSPGCFACVASNSSDANIPNCAEAGIIGPVAGMIGTIAALEAIKIIANIRPMETGSLMLIDGLYRETRVLKISPRKDCHICGER